MRIFRRKKIEPPPQQPQQPPIIIQVQQPPPQTVHVKPHVRHIPLIERPRDAESRQVIREAKLRKKLVKRGLLPENESEIEKMAREAQDLTSVLDDMRRRERKFDET